MVKPNNVRPDNVQQNSMRPKHLVISWLHSRRTIHWDRLKTGRDWSALVISTAFGAGLMPLAPGTMGTLVAVPIVYWMTPVATLWRLFFWLGILAVGTWAAALLDQTMDTEDNQNIVIDEVIGYGIAAWSAGTDLRALVAAFVLFRFFDVVKLYPVRQVDQWSKSRTSHHNGSATKAQNNLSFLHGFGVMADDVLAGMQALIVMIILQFMNWL